MLDLLLLTSLGFLGSFGHCLGMCGPIAVAFSLATPGQRPPSPWRQVAFHLALNLGRLVSYVLVGAAIGSLGSVLVAGGSVAGVGSPLRRGIALLTGAMLMGFGLRQVAPGLLPKLPVIHPLQGRLHTTLQGAMARTAQAQRWWTPAVLGLAWGLIPCGFLYAAQLKAAATSSPLEGALTLGAFGVGTLPMMVGVGASSAWLSRDRASQLFRLGGWITLAIGILTLTRTGDTMGDPTGYLALGLLVLSLIARPISGLWPGPLRYRRLIGVGAWVLAIAHSLHMVTHSWNWNLRAIRFMLPQHQQGILAGALALGLMIPLALTSSPAAQRWLGHQWRRLHLLSLPALGLGLLHGAWMAASPGETALWGIPLVPGTVLACIGLAVLAVRSRWVWTMMKVEHWYVAPKVSS